MNGLDIAREGRERHAEMLREAEAWRLVQRSKKQQTARKPWSSALLIWLGKQLIGWGRQLERAA